MISRAYFAASRPMQRVAFSFSISRDDDLLLFRAIIERARAGQLLTSFVCQYFHDIISRFLPMLGTLLCPHRVSFGDFTMIRESLFSSLRDAAGARIRLGLFSLFTSSASIDARRCRQGISVITSRPRYTATSAPTSSAIRFVVGPRFGFAHDAHGITPIFGRHD